MIILATHSCWPRQVSFTQHSQHGSGAPVISERTDEQIVDESLEAARADLAEIERSLASRDRASQDSVERVLDVPVPEMVEQLVKLQKIVSEDGIQQRTVEQIVDVPVPQAVEELAEVFRVFSQDRIQQCAVEQTIDTPATSLAEMIVEVPVIRMQEKTQ